MEKHHVGEQLKKQAETQKGNLPVEEVENEEFMPFSPEIQQAMNRILREAEAKNCK